MLGSDGLGFLGILKKAVSWDLDLDESSCLLRGARALVESWRWTNSQHSRNCVSLSSCRKPKSQEGNKSFVPEPRESSVFRGIAIYVYFYTSVYLYILYIRILWLYYNLTVFIYEICLQTRYWIYMKKKKRIWH